MELTLEQVNSMKDADGNLNLSGHISNAGCDRNRYQFKFECLERKKEMDVSLFSNQYLVRKRSEERRVGKECRL